VEAVLARGAACSYENELHAELAPRSDEDWERVKDLLQPDVSHRAAAGGREQVGW
jgi:hypothetical protein